MNRLSFLAWLWFALITLATIIANTQNNRFPFWFHPDEETKATQIMQDVRNMTHPQLLLDGVAFAVKVRNTPMERQRIVQDGRRVSAIYTGLAVGFMALLAWRLGGPLASALSGLLLFAQPLLIESAHFLKEDTALVMGWSFALLLLSYFWETPTFRRVVLFGVACGVCAAGKYVGLIVAVIGLAVVIVRMPRRWAHFAPGFLAAALLTWCAINFKVFTDLGKMTTVFGREVGRQLGVETGSDPAWLELVHELSWVGGLCALVALARWWRDRASFSATECIALVTVAVYFIPISITLRMVPRYMLPIYMVVWWVVGITLAWLILRAPLQGAVRLVLGGLLAVATLGAQANAAWKTHRGFAGEDTRLTMARYIDANLPTNSFIAYDQGAKLPDRMKKERHVKGFAPKQLMIYVDRYKNPPPVPTMLERLRGEGITHFVVNVGTMDYYMTRDFTEEFGQFADFKYRRPFYELLQKQPLLFQTKAGESKFMSPELRIFALPEAPAR